MSDPVNYLARVQPNGPVNPFGNFTQGLNLGQALKERRTLAEQQKLANEQAIENQRIANAAAQAKMVQQEQLMEAMKKLYSPDRTIEDYDQFDLLVSATMPAEQSKGLREVTANMKAEEAQAMLSGNMRIFSALLNGAPDIAVKDLRMQAEALRNSGEPDPAIILDEWANNIEKSPAGAKTIENLLAYTIMETPGGREAMENAIKYNQERRDAAAEPEAREKRLADIGLTKAQIDETIAKTNKLNAEILKINDDLAAAKESGELDPKEKFASELSLNKEYEARTKAYTESLRLNSVIKDSAASGTGAGDLALINTFIKMLDPGSVVRESEFAQAQDTAGLLSKLAASLGRVQSGQVLVPAQREEFARLADQYMTAAGVQEKKVREGLNFIVKSYGLNPESVFGTMANGKESTVATPAATPAATTASSALRDFVKSKWPAEAAKIDALSDEELAVKYPKTVAQFQPEPVRTGTW